jgi:predicted DNA-binding transcriptional regulator YafY
VSACRATTKSSRNGISFTSWKAQELRFNTPTAVWSKNRIWHPTQTLTPHKNGELTMTLTVADNRELVGWILSFGSGVRVIEPASLREAVRQEAKAIADQPEDIKGRLLDVASKRKHRA